jgi:hypothetical protein
MCDHKFGNWVTWELQLDQFIGEFKLETIEPSLTFELSSIYYLFLSEFNIASCMWGSLEKKVKCAPPEQANKVYGRVFFN